MFGHRNEQDESGDGPVSVSVVPPSPEERAHVLKKGKAIVGKIAQAAASPQDDETTIWHLDVTYTDGSKQHEVRFVDRIESRFHFQAGSYLPIRVGSTTIVDDVHLASRMAQERALGVAAEVKRWTLPDHCPNCGAPVNQAMQSFQSDPRCPFCEQPLPVQ